MRIAIAGTGLIGGSLATDLKKRGFASTVTGIETNPEHARVSKAKGLVDRVGEMESAIDSSDLIILATPTDTIKSVLPRVLDRVAGTDKVVTDVGSAKAGIAEVVKDHPARKQYVAAHPMAGTEYSGPGAAKSSLFDNKTAIICDARLSDPDALEAIKKMFNVLNMNTIFMDSGEHDISAAYVSHFSHIISFALSLSVQEKEKNYKKILAMAGGGFDSTVRLAKSSPGTWTPVLLENAPYINEVIDNYIEKLYQFRKAIQNSDRQKIDNLIIEANKIENILM